MAKAFRPQFLIKSSFSKRTKKRTSSKVWRHFAPLVAKPVEFFQLIYEKKENVLFIKPRVENIWWEQSYQIRDVVDQIQRLSKYK